MGAEGQLRWPNTSVSLMVGWQGRIRHDLDIMDNLRHIIFLIISDLTMLVLPIRMATKINTTKKVKG